MATKGYYAVAICEACGGDSFMGLVAQGRQGLDLQCINCGVIDKSWGSSSKVGHERSGEATPALPDMDTDRDKTLE